MYLLLAWRNIWRNRRRTIITISSIGFAVLLACIMRSLQLGSYERMIENSARFYTGFIQVHDNGYWNEKTVDNSFQFDKSLRDLLNSISGVEVAVPRVESFALSAFGTKTKGAMVLGIDPDLEHALTKVKDKMVAGNYLEAEDQGAVIGEGLSTYLNAGIGDTLILIGQGYHGANAAGLFVIKGIMKFPVPDQNNQTIYITLAQAQNFYAMPNLITSVSLVVDKVQNVERITNEIKAEVDPKQVEVMDWEEMMPDLIQAIEIDNFSGKVMLWILYAVIGFGMFGTFLMMTQERLYEFGVMMSIGMRRYVLQLIIFLEMGILAAMGVLAGVGLSLPILFYYHSNPVFMTGESAEAIEQFGVEAAYFFSLEPSLFYNQAWAIFFMAFVLAMYPLYKIFRLKPVEAMRTA